MTSGLPQVCKLWFGVSKGMPCVKHLAPKNHGSQLLWAPASPKVGVGGKMPTIKRKVQPCILERASLAYSMTGGLLSAFGFALGRGS